MRKHEIVKDNNKFNNIIQTGKYVKNNYFVIYIKKSEIEKPHFGIAVGKKMGNAVIRNKYKRQIRFILDKNKKSFQNYNDYIIMIKRTCNDIDFNKLQDQLVNLIESKVKQ